MSKDADVSSMTKGHTTDLAYVSTVFHFMMIIMVHHYGIDPNGAEDEIKEAMRKGVATIDLHAMDMDSRAPHNTATRESFNIMSDRVCDPAVKRLAAFVNKCPNLHILLGQSDLGCVVCHLVHDEIDPKRKVQFFGGYHPMYANDLSLNGGLVREIRIDFDRTINTVGIHSFMDGLSRVGAAMMGLTYKQMTKEESRSLYVRMFTDFGSYTSSIGNSPQWYPIGEASKMEKYKGKIKPGDDKVFEGYHVKLNRTSLIYRAPGNVRFSGRKWALFYAKDCSSSLKTYKEKRGLSLSQLVGFAG